MGRFAPPLTSIAWLIFYWLKLRKRQRQQQEKLLRLSQRPGRIHPYFPDKTRSPPYHQQRRDFDTPKKNSTPRT